MRTMKLPNLHRLVDQLQSLLPESATQAQAEIRQNLKIFLESSLTKMNLVTREEFDAQSALLVRTREKLDRLEAIIADLEKRG